MAAVDPDARDDKLLVDRFCAAVNDRALLPVPRVRDGVRNKGAESADWAPAKGWGAGGRGCSLPMADEKELKPVS